MAYKDTDKILVHRDGVDYQAELGPLLGGGAPIDLPPCGVALEYLGEFDPETEWGPPIYEGLGSSGRGALGTDKIEPGEIRAVAGKYWKVVDPRQNEFFQPSDTWLWDSSDLQNPPLHLTWDDQYWKEPNVGSDTIGFKGAWLVDGVEVVLIYPYWSAFPEEDFTGFALGRDNDCGEDAVDAVHWDDIVGKPSAPPSCKVKIEYLGNINPRDLGDVIEEYKLPSRSNRAIKWHTYRLKDYSQKVLFEELDEVIAWGAALEHDDEYDAAGVVREADGTEFFWFQTSNAGPQSRYDSVTRMGTDLCTIDDSIRFMPLDLSTLPALT